MVAELLGESFIYAYFIGVLQLVAVAAVALFTVPAIFVRGLRAYLSCLNRLLLFNVFLLAFGVVGNAAWYVTAWDKLYVSMDPLVDFVPFIPAGQWILDAEYGGQHGFLINGATVWSLRVLWAAIASAVWWLTIWTYRAFTKLDERAGRPSTPSAGGDGWVTLSLNP